MFLGVMIFVFLIFQCSLALALSSFTFIRSCFKSLLLSVSKVVSCVHLKLLTFCPPFLLLLPLNLVQFLYDYVLNTD